jgi:DNA phosphorothioation-associated putative methyltransferase
LSWLRPTYFPDKPRKPADVVNLGFVVNVIEDRAERAKVLQRAWELTQRLLIVSAGFEGEGIELKGRSWGDGILTRTGTFQKLYTQQGLRHWIETTLEVESVAAAPGIFYVFRSQHDPF